MIERPAVIIGLGQLGRAFGEGLLACGVAVVPVRREDDPAALAARLPAPELVLVTVGEDDLPLVLASLPAAWRDRIALVQNELLPPDWRAHAIVDPTVCAVWFEKKRGRPTKIVLPTLVAGSRAPRLLAALAAIDVPAREIAAGELLDALVAKNLYIVTSNLAGLALPEGASTRALWSEHRALAEEVAREVLAIEAARAGVALDVASHLDRLGGALLADPEHGLRGRSAPARLARALARAAALGVETPALARLAG